MNTKYPLRPDRAALTPSLVARMPTGWTVYAEWKATPTVQMWIDAHFRTESGRPLVNGHNVGSIVKEAIRRGLAESRIGPSERWEIRRTNAPGGD